MPSSSTAVVAALVVLACGGTRAPIQPAIRGRSTPTPPGELLGPARVVPPTDGADISAETIEPDGSRRLVTQGLRVVERPDGSIDVADVWLPASRGVRATRLASRLGGGFLFAAQASSATLLYSAPSFTGALTPLARIDADVDDVVSGFDRIYLSLRRATEWVALDPATGEARDLGSLPPSAGYGSMAFADEWFGVVLTPFRGALASFDAGGTWHPLGLSVTGLWPREGGVLLAVGQDHYELDARGSLLSAAESSVQASRRTSPGPALPQAAAAQKKPLGARALETVVLNGFAESQETALVATGGMLIRARLRDGSVVDARAGAYAGLAPCDPVPLGGRGAFVCNEGAGRTSLYVHEPPLALRPLIAFSDVRRVASGGNGALLVSGGCGETSDGDEALCVITGTGARYDVKAAAKGARTVPLPDGGIVALLPPRPGVHGLLVRRARGAAERRLILALPSDADRVTRALLAEGFWLDSFEAGPDGELRGWLAGGGVFAGVRVDARGKVRVGPVQQYLDRALLSGRYGLVLARGGAALETTDGGFEWDDVELPSEPEFKPSRTAGAQHGCTANGCAFSGWLRIGWGGAKTQRQVTAASPERVKLSLAQGGRWSLDCLPGREVSQAALPLKPEAAERGASPWNPLAELRPPAAGRGDTTFDMGSEPESRGFRAYAWGPPLDGWARGARWLVRSVDPFAVKDGVWSTAPSPVPWSSPELTADAFGLSPSGPPVSTRLVFDPRERAGLLVMNLRGATELYWLEEGKGIVALKGGGVGAVSSVARAGSAVYVAALGESQSLRVYRADVGALTVVGEYADLLPRSEPPALAPAVRGDGLGLWVRSGNYYLYPLDPERGTLDSPLEFTAESLSRMPRSCSPDEDGYLVGDALTIEPRIDLETVGPSPRVGNGVEVRLVVSDRGVCTDGLAAPASGRAALARPSTPSAERSGPGVRLVLSDPQPGGLRQSYECWD